VFRDKDLKSNLHYDPDTGVFTWLKFRSRYAKVGAVAGCVENHHSGKKYLTINFAGKLYLAHRLAWFYVHGIEPNQIDHINGNGI